MDIGDIGAWLLVSAGIALGIRGIVAIVERRQEQPALAPTVIKATRQARKRKTGGPTGAAMPAGVVNSVPAPVYAEARQ
jgi:hypothetical protein